MILVEGKEIVGGERWRGEAASPVHGVQNLRLADGVTIVEIDDGHRR